MRFYAIRKAGLRFVDNRIDRWAQRLQVFATGGVAFDRPVLYPASWRRYARRPVLRRADGSAAAIVEISPLATIYDGAQFSMPP